MGAYLSAPKTEKQHEQGENEWVRFASTSMQGWRAHQEDAHNACLDFSSDPKCCLFGVYDGHGGKDVAIYTSQNLPEFLKNAGLLNEKDIASALKKCFVDFDNTLKDEDVIQTDVDDVEEREALFEEAIALSKEASVSLESIIRQYAKIRNRMDPSSESIFEIKPEKRAIGESSTREIKRRRIHRENATTAEDDETCEADASTSIVEVTLEKVNGSSDKNGSTDLKSDNHDTDVGSTEKNAEPTKESTATKKDLNTAAGDSKTDDDPVSSSTSFATSASKNNDSKKMEGEPDSNTDEDEDDEDYQASAEGYDSGATACVALLFENKVIVANVGDSRAVLCRDGSAVDLSVDHKPEDTTEKERIEKAGGCVSEDGRVNGGLNLSRALGDHFYKRNADIPMEDQMITAVPDIQEIELTDKDTWLIVACDGIWNSMSSQEVVDFVNERRDSKSLKEIGAELCDHCCAPDTSGDGTGCDNMTVQLIQLLRFKGPNQINQTDNSVQQPVEQNNQDN
ncbi:protein phosphatase 2C domain-containing protein [Ditylenchus destructor]|uniref:protein-serine/threonine phosphatase n=1 Tax=Ditylenchus destructor TaxID=166010 RepID=A0AAD4NHV7_9BILA|nr:protein phosphatase 2C domain-containing protein [Ditylenchus destructor]